MFRTTQNTSTTTMLVRRISVGQCSHLSDFYTTMHFSTLDSQWIDRKNNYIIIDVHQIALNMFKFCLCNCPFATAPMFLLSIPVALEQTKK